MAIIDFHEQVCVFTTVEYDLTQGPELTGNYFEVSVMSIGQKDIGIGLADRAVFPADSRMPGWVDGSYGIPSLSFLTSFYAFYSISLTFRPFLFFLFFTFSPPFSPFNLSTFTP